MRKDRNQIEMRICKRSLSVILILALCFTMIFADYGVANAETQRGKVVKIKYLMPSSITIEENTNGQWSWDKETQDYYYRYSELNKDSGSFIAVYENGEEVRYTYSLKYIGTALKEYLFIGDDGTRITETNVWRSDQEEKHFTVGEDNYFTFTFQDITIKVPVEITEKSQEKIVESIELQPKGAVEYSFSDSQVIYNGSLKKEQNWFEPTRGFQEGDKLIVTKSNQVAVTYTYTPKTIIEDEESGAEYWSNAKFVAENGDEITVGDLRFSTDQDLSDGEWKSGSDNCYFILEYGGAKTRVAGTVKQNEVERIELLSEDSMPSYGCDVDPYEVYCTFGGVDVYNFEGNKIDTITLAQLSSDGESDPVYYFKNGNGEEVPLSIYRLSNKMTGQLYVSYQGVSCKIPTIHYEDNAKWVIKETPTCEKQGVYEKKCVCGEVIETQSIPVDPTAHKFTKYIYNNDAKVGVDGTETAKCDNGCGKKETRIKIGSALGNGGSGSITPPPTTDQSPTISEGEGYSTFIGDKGKTVLILVDDGYEISDVKVNGVSKGSQKKITGLKKTDKVEVFVITKEEKIQSIKKELKAVSSKNFFSRSAQVKMKSGKKALKIHFVNKSNVKFDGIEVFRSTKKNTGYKKLYTTKKDKYYNTAIKKGTRYYYRARGYVEYDGIKYYSDWSAKAWCTVK